MTIIYYPAIIERAATGYSTFFPDLPGCTSAGTTLQEAARNAEEALTGHLLVCAEHGDTIAAPSDLDSVPHDPDVDEVVRVLVRADMPGRSVRINITLDEALIAAIDNVAANRSRFLADAARTALAARSAGARF